MLYFRPLSFESLYLKQLSRFSFTFSNFLLRRNDIKSVVVPEPPEERSSKEGGGEKSNLNIRKIEEAFEKK